MTTTITAEHAGDLYDSEDGEIVGPWTKVGSQHVRQSRWHNIHWLVVRNAAGEHWGLLYHIGLTEYQENELPWEEYGDGPFELTRLYPHEVTRVEYRKTPAEGDPS